MTEPALPQVVDLETRKAVLARAIAQHVAMGKRVESQTDTTAILVWGKKPNHILHAILTLLLLGIWLIVWIILAITSKEHRLQLLVDEYGQLQTTQLS